MALSPSISGIQNQNKTALGRIKTKEDLTQHYKVLAAAHHEVIAGIQSAMTYMFVREGYGSKETAQRAQSCLPYRIMRDSYQ
eukprot:7839418-Ditylum_brightwellii.AAC.2